MRAGLDRSQTMEKVYSESDMILDEVFQVMDATTQDVTIRGARLVQVRAKNIYILYYIYI